MEARAAGGVLINEHDQSWTGGMIEKSSPLT